MRALISICALILHSCFNVFASNDHSLHDSSIIQLNDNTEKDSVVADCVLGKYLCTSEYSLSYTLLQNKVSKYFHLEMSTGRLITKKSIDRDYLCAESALCCTQNIQDPTSSIMRMSQMNSPHQSSVCQLRLNVATTDNRERGQAPVIRPILIHIQDENDNSPVFLLPDINISYSEWGKLNSRAWTHPPILHVNVSESAPVGNFRVHLPLATDFDLYPFNVQNYLPETNGFPRRIFELKVTKGKVDQTVLSVAEDESIIALELLLIGQLDREETSNYGFSILAVDGVVSPQLTGTLSVSVRVTDANDNLPIFEQNVYEANIKEGDSGILLLQVKATDLDEGDNSEINYKWLEDYSQFGPDTHLLNKFAELSESTISSLGSDSLPDRRAKLQNLPNYWFRLDSKSGKIYVHRPLDYEIKRGFNFHIQAINPGEKITTSTDVFNSAMKSPKHSLTTAEVIINVINLNDEKPQIVIDYLSGNDSIRYARIMENVLSGYFLALIRVTDADSGDQRYFDVSEGTFSNTRHVIEIGRLNKSGRVTCELVSHEDNYTLVERASSIGSEYSLLTKTPLDREKEQHHSVVIKCSDHGVPKMSSTAKIEVEILDENDCYPEISVYHPVTSKNSRLSQSIMHPILRTSLEKVLKDFDSDFSNRHDSEHPLEIAYSAGIPVIPVIVAENQPSGTVVANLRAVDQDKGLNGSVGFRAITDSVQIPRLRPNYVSNYTANNHLEVEFDTSFPNVRVSSEIDAVELFMITSAGELSTRRIIDREEFPSLRQEMYLFIEARDFGTPALSSFVLLALTIEDENDNPPVFLMSQMNFNVRENMPVPHRVGEITVSDADQPIPTPTDPGIGHRKEKQPQVTKFIESSIRLFISPSHGLPDLPFVIDSNGEDISYLNLTRKLDRESEESFKFEIIATDYRNVANFVIRSATATIFVNVEDVNDNAPEFIFPRPNFSSSTVYRLSYKEEPGYSILTINAKDKDSDKLNGRISFESMAADSSIPDIDAAKLAKTAFSDDLFRVDSARGLLQTIRRMSDEDIGEHWVQLIVRDFGTPPLYTRQTICLNVERTQPHLLGRGYFDFPENKDTIFSHYPVNSLQPSYENYDSRLFLGTSLDEKSNKITDLTLFIVISIVLVVLLIIGSFIIYIRHRHNIFTFFPDICAVASTNSSNKDTFQNACCMKKVISKDNLSDDRSSKSHLKSEILLSPSHLQRITVSSNGRVHYLMKPDTGNTIQQKNQGTRNFLKNITNDTEHFHATGRHFYPTDSIDSSSILNSVDYIQGSMNFGDARPDHSNVNFSSHLQNQPYPITFNGVFPIQNSNFETIVKNNGQSSRSHPTTTIYRDFASPLHTRCSLSDDRVFVRPIFLPESDQYLKCGISSCPVKAKNVSSSFSAGIQHFDDSRFPSSLHSPDYQLLQNSNVRDSLVCASPPENIICFKNLPRAVDSERKIDEYASRSACFNSESSLTHNDEGDVSGSPIISRNWRQFSEVRTCNDFTPNSSINPFSTPSIRSTNTAGKSMKMPNSNEPSKTGIDESDNNYTVNFPQLEASFV